MKKLMWLALILVLLLNLSALAEAKEIRSGGFTYRLLADGTAQITRWSGSERELVLPEELDGHAVTSLAAGAFEGCEDLQELTLSRNLRDVEGGALEGENPTGLYAPLGSWAEAYCEARGLLALTPTEQCGEYVYALRADGTAIITWFEGDYEATKALDIPAELDGHAVTAIDESAFSGYDCLEVLTIPGSVTEIGNYAFSDTAIMGLTLPEGVARLGEGAFSGCKKLTSVALPASLAEMEGNAFFDCMALEEITVAPENEAFEVVEGALFRRADRALVCPPAAAMEAEYAVPEGTERIGDFAFAYCAGLESVVLPDSVTAIGASAFSECTGLRAVALPAGLTVLGESAFYDCTSLENIALPAGIGALPDYLFSRCEGLASVTLPEGLKRLGASAFGNCARLATLEIPETVTDIGDGAFMDCASLKRLTLPEGLANVGESAFSGCSALTSLNLFIHVKKIGEGAFEDCPNLTVTVPSNSYAGDWCRRNGVPTMDPRDAEEN